MNNVGLYSMTKTPSLKKQLSELQNICGRRNLYHKTSGRVYCPIILNGKIVVEDFHGKHIEYINGDFADGYGQSVAI